MVFPLFNTNDGLRAARYSPMRRLIILSLVLLPVSAFAQEGIITDVPGCDFTTGILQASCIPSFVAHMIQLLFGFTGILCLFNIMIGGYQIAIGAATGDKEKGKQRITWALIGLILSVAAYLILDVVLSALFG